MTELKTLKDIDFEIGIKPRFLEVNADFDYRIIEFINSKLKAETIKWVKEARTMRKESECYSPLNVGGVNFQPCEEYGCDAVDLRIIHFFNLTEEEICANTNM